MKIVPLSEIGIEEIVHCFNAAFANYFVKFDVDAAYLTNRWKGARVNLSLSYGVVMDGKLVGFMVTGIDELQGLTTAHNAGTGVLPDFRGRGLVGEMYIHALPIFKREGVKQCSLEVITQNAPAIRAYEKVGLAVRRELACFSGKVSEGKIDNEDAFKIDEKRDVDWEIVEQLIEFQPSWEYVKAAIEILPEQYGTWLSYRGNTCMAFAIVHRLTGAVLQFGMAKEKHGLNAGHHLFQEIGRQYGEVKVNNVDKQANRSIALLTDLGLGNHIDQYEMFMQL